MSTKERIIHMQHDIRWGIVAPGRIAEKFAEALSGTKGSVLYAAASRSLDRAKAFSERFGAVKAYGSYEELVSDDNVDVVYIANIHPYHFDSAKLALNAGKAVLCEKPMTLNAGETEALISTARSKNVFLMEAMWMRYNPALNKVKSLIDAGRIGRIRKIDADFSYVARFGSRQIEPELGGGALLDLGIYPISLANWLIGRFPEAVSSQSVKTATGVDGTDRISFNWKSGETAELTCGVESEGSMSAKIVGTDGMITVPCQFHAAERFTLHTAAGTEEFSYPFRINGYEYEAEEVVRCLKSGLLESPVIPLDETLATMKLMDSLRAEWGVVYPGE
jgi:predicted dehydrogenase